MNTMMPNKEPLENLALRLVEEIKEMGSEHAALEPTVVAYVMGLVQSAKDELLHEVSVHRSKMEKKPNVDRSFVQDYVQRCLDVSSDYSHPVSQVRVYFEEIIREVASAGIQEGMKIQQNITKESRDKDDLFERNHPRL